MHTHQLDLMPPADSAAAQLAAAAFERVASNFAATLHEVRAQLAALFPPDVTGRRDPCGQALWHWTVSLEMIIEQLDAVVGVLRPGTAYATA